MSMLTSYLLSREPRKNSGCGSVTYWTTEKSWFDFGQGQETIIIFSEVSKPAWAVHQASMLGYRWYFPRG
jgi:hypothetical protein